MTCRLGYRLRRIREEKGISQEALADALGLSQSTVARIEAGKSKLAAQHVLEICRILELRVEEFLKADFV